MVLDCIGMHLIDKFLRQIACNCIREGIWLLDSYKKKLKNKIKYYFNILLQYDKYFHVDFSERQEAKGNKNILEYQNVQAIINKIELKFETVADGIKDHEVICGLLCIHR